MSKVNMDAVSKLSNLLPTGTFLGFQAFAPIFTNNGDCATTEKIMTGILLVIFAILCCGLTFTDSVIDSSGEVYQGIVTRKGLFSPQLKGIEINRNDVIVGYYYDDEEHKYRVTVFDFFNAVLNVIVFGSLTLLTPPISTCYYGGISNTIVQTVPILVGIVISVYFAFAPPPRKGVGFSHSQGSERLPRPEQEAPSEQEQHEQHEPEQEAPQVVPSRAPDQGEISVAAPAESTAPSKGRPTV